MKKLLFGTSLLVMLIFVPLASLAQVSVQVNIPLPPPIVFAAPPDVVLLPGTNVYAVPDVEAEIFFRLGWWWRSWNNRWYRSRYYDHGWGYYRGYPAWYRGIPHDWRDSYRNHRWHGQPWNYHSVPYGNLNRQFKGGHANIEHRREHPGGQFVNRGPRGSSPGRPGGEAVKRGDHGRPDRGHGAHDVGRAEHGGGHGEHRGKDQR